MSFVWISKDKREWSERIQFYDKNSDRGGLKIKREMIYFTDKLRQVAEMKFSSFFTLKGNINSSSFVAIKSVALRHYLILN